MDNYSRFFKGITGFEPYIYQEEMNERFQEQSGVILQAPTGAGKTLSAILPFVYSWYQWKGGQQSIDSFPRKLIYSLPLRTLANSLYQIAKVEAIEKKLPNLGIKVTLQTGEHPNDPLFEGDIIFTTIDQTLSNVLCIPLSLPKKLANINAGAVVSSYLVFDEVHLLDTKRSLRTVISLLKEMRSLVPFCLMTATLSNKFIDNLSNYLSSSIIRITDEDFRNFSFVRNKALKMVYVDSNKLSAKQVIEQHKEKSIVICNTVDRCINLYREVKEVVDKDAGKDIEVICIHSRFFQRHRKEKELQITELFGQGSSKQAILISTQVIEVGLDISCDVMHSEISPINSFLQRIGRCSRWQGSGKVIVYDVCEDSYFPYDKELSKNTLEVLTRLDGEEMNLNLSQKLIEEVLGEEENNIFNSLSDASVLTMNSIRDAWMIGGKDKTRDLIRNIDSISVVIIPANMKTYSLYQFEAISMNRYSLKKKLTDRLNDVEGEIPELVFSLEESNMDFEEDKFLVPIPPESVLNYTIVALNSEYIGYNEEYGLDFTDSGKCQSLKLLKQSIPTYTINRDTYEEHIQWMLDYLKNETSHPYILNRLEDEKYIGYCLINLLRYVFIFHDYGKLDVQWQKFANDYQKEKFRMKGKQWKDCFLAHTDYDPNNQEDKEIEKRSGKRPHHAGVGAYVTRAVMPYIFRWDKSEEAKSLWEISISTISRHHNAFSVNSPAFIVDEKGVILITILLNQVGIGLNDEIINNKVFRSGKKDSLGSYQVQFNEPIETFTYFIFTRMLRLCDQRSFTYNPLYKKER